MGLCPPSLAVPVLPASPPLQALLLPPAPQTRPLPPALTRCQHSTRVRQIMESVKERTRSGSVSKKEFAGIVHQVRGLAWGLRCRAAGWPSSTLCMPVASPAKLTVPLTAPRCARTARPRATLAQPWHRRCAASPCPRTKWSCSTAPLTPTRTVRALWRCPQLAAGGLPLAGRCVPPPPALCNPLPVTRPGAASLLPASRLPGAERDGAD